MSLVFDVAADQPPSTGRLAVQDLTSEEVAALAEELVSYHQHFAPWFSRREQREWAAGYLRGLLTADVPRKNVEAMTLRLLGVGPPAQRQVRLLLQVALPQPGLDLPAVLALIAYQQRHNYAAYGSHRKRLLAQLQGLRW
jgi:hypothetical protein